MRPGSRDGPPSGRTGRSPHPSSDDGTTRRRSGVGRSSTERTKEAWRAMPLRVSPPVTPCPRKCPICGSRAGRRPDASWANAGSGTLTRGRIGWRWGRKDVCRGMASREGTYRQGWRSLLPLSPPCGPPLAAEPPHLAHSGGPLPCARVSSPTWTMDRRGNRPTPARRWSALSTFEAWLAPVEGAAARGGDVRPRTGSSMSAAPPPRPRGSNSRGWRRPGRSLLTSPGPWFRWPAGPGWPWTRRRGPRGPLGARRPAPAAPPRRAPASGRGPP